MRGAIVALLFAVLSVLVVEPIDAQTDGLVYSEDTVLTVEDGVVEVEISATMSNTTVDRVEGSTLFYEFFDVLPIVVPAEVEDFVVISRGVELSSRSEPIDAQFELREVLLGSQLRAGESRSFAISYRLPAGELRGTGLFVSNPAYFSFPLWSASDPGTGSLQLRISESAELNDVGESMRRTGTEDGFEIYEPIDFSTPSELFAYVIVTDETVLDSETFTVSGQQIELNYWPGDEEWADFARSTIRVGLPTLEELITLEIPEQSTLEVNESAMPYFFGYGGWYDAVNTSIDVGNALDETVMIHELSHAWFNGNLFEDRWVLEGLAEEITWRAQDRLGTRPGPVPDAPSITDRGALPLSEWNSNLIGTVNSEDLFDREEYAYDASWFVIRNIVDTIGLEDAQAVVRDAAERRPSYPSSGGVDSTDIASGWRRLLDLSSVYATPEEEEALVDVFGDYVATAEEQVELELRREARQDFSILDERDPGWDIPDRIRAAMAEWDFDVAGELLETSRAVQDRYLRIEATIDGTDLEVSEVPRQLYESNEGGIADSFDLLEEQFVAVESIVGLRSELDGPLSVRQRIGLIGVDVDAGFDQAREALLGDDFSEVSAALDDVGDLDQAEERGTRRLAVVATTLALFAMFGAFAVIRRSSKGSAMSDEIRPVETTSFEDSEELDEMAA